MNGKLVVAFSSVMLLASCVSRRSGDVTFLWTFAGQTCAQTPGVTQVHISIPGEALDNGGVYPCTSAGVDGIVLQNFIGDIYDFTIDGEDSAGNILYSASGSFTVNGSVTVSVDLSPVAGPNTSALISWIFPAPGGVTAHCATLQIVNVNVIIDNGAPITRPCTDGDGTVMWQTPALEAGTHQLQLDALDTNGTVDFSAAGTFTTAVGSTASESFTFQYGGVDVGWSLFNNTGQATTCATASITTLYLQLYTGSTPYFAGSGAAMTCASGSAQSFPVRPGTYTAVVSGTDTGGTIYTSNTATPPTISVLTGVFPDNTCTLGGSGCIGTLVVNGQ